MKVFTTDGCSGGMSSLWTLFTGKLPPWQDACVEHDRAYWKGGMSAQRRIADIGLLIDVARYGYAIWAIIMWLSVRIGGHPLLPLPWRWGYGHPWPRNYTRN